MVVKLMNLNVEEGIVTYFKLLSQHLSQRLNNSTKAVSINDF